MRLTGIIWMLILVYEYSTKTLSISFIFLRMSKTSDNIRAMMKNEYDESTLFLSYRFITF